MKLFSLKRKASYHSDSAIDSLRILSDTTPFAVKEAYRSLYSNVLYLPIESRCKKIAVTSAYPGEGKTSISINLAYSIAENSPESTVLIVDSDMRSPRVAELINKENHGVHGLSEYLAGIDAVPNFQPTVHPNLSFLSSGATNANTPGLLSGSRMEAFIQLIDESFDYVIFDTPPVNVVADAVLLADRIDGYLVATRADFSDTNSFGEAVKKLETAGAKVFGVVLCAYNAKSGKGYGKSGRYGRYGKYGKYGKYGSYYGGSDSGNGN
ncbi:MAG: CpsD/CapB family tyrosine-protein kinase [Clostridia bacterium]|nr:CpsD/CapB family tyrosine-protein kinase [Clostridia bacterium]